ncbi:MAG TPA: site-specific DNA-methyltransferase [Armatimonadota bacterium]
MDCPDRLLFGDNLALMREMAADEGVAGRVNLVYMDPPFNTGGTFYVGGSSGGRGTTETVAYRDRRGLNEYLAFMRERIEALKPLLAPRASVFLHADARAIHYLKVLMDEVFGLDAFVNEIIWHYRSGGTARKRYSAKHDTILWYAPCGEPAFNREAVSTLERGDRRNHMKRTVNAAGETVRTIRSNGKTYEYPAEGGAPPDDVWDDISHLNQRDPERTGYATQKPLALLERIIAGSSSPGDLVLDPFCGSGTTLVAAQRLGRRWIGIDASEAAIEVCKHRVSSSGTQNSELGTRNSELETG